MTEKSRIEYKTFQLYLDCNQRKEGKFNLNDFYNFYKNKNIKIFTEQHGIAIVSFVKNECELYFLGVRNDKEGLGYGTNILKKVIEHSKELRTKKIFLEVNVNNKVALKLYTNAGFTRLSIRKDYYKNLINSFDDAILMELLMIY